MHGVNVQESSRDVKIMARAEKEFSVIRSIAEKMRENVACVDIRSILPVVETQ